MDKGASMKKNYKTITVGDKYVPKKNEEYMSEEQKAYFYQLLMAEKDELVAEMAEADGVADLVQGDGGGGMDEGDAATLSIGSDMNIKMRARNQSQIKRIDEALRRLEEGTYGYSIISGDEIGLKRLMARPVAAITMEEKEESEK